MKRDQTTNGGDGMAIAKAVTYFDHSVVIACDAKCEKAWGINNRPKVMLSETDEDDYAYLADDELGTAPIDPGTYEGGHAKPRQPSDRLNKWCCRECERCDMADAGKLLQIRDFSKRVFNKHWRDDLLAPSPAGE